MRSEIKFIDKNPISVFMKPLTSFTEFQDIIIQKLGLHGMKRLEKLFYRIPISVLQDDVKYDSFVIGTDEDLKVFFHYHRRFPEVRTPELLAKLVDVVFSSGSSNWIPLSSTMVAFSSSRPNEDDDDVEPTTFADDSDDEDARNTPAGGGGVASSGTPQYPLHFSAFDLDAMRQQENLVVLVRFGTRDIRDIEGLAEFLVGQQFQDKEEAVLSVKTYIFRRRIEYKVLESDYHKYRGKFGELYDIQMN
ncbi:uncharacterized protein LOC130949047 [Arachis stenosperma]|uniref:uncharacterized protein LOC130949047 n=1 Tax=Arachis stenosperma TaxID=217475 RepID=UPI0025AC9465|nr:uncharacterized protein LOC130949047 [Arachis stenosperma]